MHLQDHYKTLELEPSATLQEIKAAYRKLAMLHHPDVNQDDQYAVARFNEIKEAYETLTNPQKRYDYLQQRWYNRATGNTQTAQIVTPVNVLKQALEFERYTAMLDMFRMDRQQLFDFMNNLVDEYAATVLRQFDEPDVNRQIVHTLLKPVTMLHLTQAMQLQPRLSHIVAGDEPTIKAINTTLSAIRSRERWERYKWLLVLAITIAICWMIATFA